MVLDTEMLTVIPTATQLQTIPVQGHGLMKPAKAHHMQKKRCNPKVTKLDTLRSLAAPRDSVHANHKIGDKAEQSWHLFETYFGGLFFICDVWSTHVGSFQCKRYRIF